MSAYLGEVLIRNLGGAWTAMPQGPTPDDPGIAWDGLNALPFEKVRKRIALGPSHGIRLFVEEASHAKGLTVDQRRQRWRPFERRRTP